MTLPTPAMRYALDADVIIRLQKAHQLQALKAIGRLPVIVTDVVWDEVVGDSDERPSTRESRELEDVLRSIAGAPTVLLPESQEAHAFVRLDAPNFGAGERSMIAYALCHPDVTAVLLDKLALHRAVEELRGERVLSLHGFLRALEPHGVGKALANAISQAFCRANAPHRPPLWW